MLQTDPSHPGEGVTMSEIQRYSMGHAHGTTAIVPEEDSLGHWVKHSDHRAALSAKDAELAEMRQELDRAANLLAVIHGDGGHYITEHGWEKAVGDAKSKWYEVKEAGRVLAEECKAARALLELDTEFMERQPNPTAQLWGLAKSEVADDNNYSDGREAVDKNPLAARLLAEAGKGDGHGN